MLKQGIDIYNAQDPFFNNICYPFKENDSDITLGDRRNEVYSNETFCEDGCEYKGINYDTTTVQCDCELKTILSIEVKNNNDNSHNFFSELLKETNLFIVICYQNVFKWSSISYNLGFYIFGALTSAQFVLTFLIFLKGIPKLLGNANHLANPTKYSFSNFFEKKGNNSSNTRSSRNYIAKESNISQIVLTQKKKDDKKGYKHNRNIKRDSMYMNNNKTDSSIQCKTKKLNQNQTLKKNDDDDINEYPFTKAVREDNRNPFILFCSFFSSKWSIYQMIYSPSQFEIFHLSLSLFIFGFSLDLTFNSILFSDDIISEKYHNKGELNVFTPYILSALSSILSLFIVTVISRIITTFPKFLEIFSREVKDRTQYILLLKTILKQIKIRIIIFQFITIIFSLFMWYYITCFCTVFKGSQSNWIHDSILGVFIGIATSFAVALLIVVLRFIALKLKFKQWYNISKFIDKSI